MFTAIQWILLCATAGLVSGASGVCITPDGYAGRCTDVHACAHLRLLLSFTPIADSDKLFLRKSKCTGPYPYAVCCRLPPAEPQGPADSHQTCGDTDGIPDAASGCCGMLSKNAQTSGNGTFPEMNPWMALLEYRTNGPTGPRCAGALISSRHVLTAAHCVTGARLATLSGVRLGCAAAGGACALVLPAERSVAHALYEPATRSNDVAVVRLASGAPYTDLVRPICLPRTDPAALRAYSWDAPAAPAAHETACRRPGRLCAGTCAQSGSPLVLRDGALHRLAGVASLAPPCPAAAPAAAPALAPALYTDVYAYREWITSVVGP